MYKLIKNKWVVGVPMLLAAGLATAQTDERISARWDDGRLVVIGTSGPDDLSIASSGGLIEVNGGLVLIDGGFATLRNTVEIAVHGLAGNDQIVLYEWNGTLPNADLDGGPGNDLLIGGDGADVLRGGAGNDTLLGNRGNDVVLGEDGNDLLIVNAGDGNDLFDGGRGHDRTQIHGDEKAQEISLQPLAADGAVVFITDSIEAGEVRVSSSESIDVRSQGGGDVIIASTGLSNVAVLDLDGGEGNDLLIGSDGVDVLNGGDGRDWCESGGGRDRFVSCEDLTR